MNMAFHYGQRVVDTTDNTVGYIEWLTPVVVPTALKPGVQLGDLDGSVEFWSQHMTPEQKAERLHETVGPMFAYQTLLAVHTQEYRRMFKPWVRASRSEADYLRLVDVCRDGLLCSLKTVRGNRHEVFDANIRVAPATQLDIQLDFEQIEQATRRQIRTDYNPRHEADFWEREQVYHQRCLQAALRYATDAPQIEPPQNATYMSLSERLDHVEAFLSSAFSRDR